MGFLRLRKLRCHCAHNVPRWQAPARAKKTSRTARGARAVAPMCNCGRVASSAAVDAHQHESVVAFGTHRLRRRGASPTLPARFQWRRSASEASAHATKGTTNAPCGNSGSLSVQNSTSVVTAAAAPASAAIHAIARSLGRGRVACGRPAASHAAATTPATSRRSRPTRSAPYAQNTCRYHRCATSEYRIYTAAAAESTNAGADTSAAAARTKGRRLRVMARTLAGAAAAVDPHGNRQAQTARSFPVTPCARMLSRHGTALDPEGTNRFPAAVRELPQLSGKGAALDGRSRHRCRLRGLLCGTEAAHATGRRRHAARAGPGPRRHAEDPADRRGHSL